MRNIDKVRTSCYNHHIEDVHKRMLFLAYLQLHTSKPGLHPDDYLDPEGGYSGWEVILMEETHTKKSGYAPDQFTYPCWALKMSPILDLLKVFHQDRSNDSGLTPDEIELYGRLLVNVEAIGEFMMDMQPTELQTVTEMLEDLVAYHRTDLDDEDAPVNVLIEALKVFSWVKQFK